MPRATRIRIHNEWFMPSASEKRCNCGSNVSSRTAAGHDPVVYINGAYIYGKWHREGLVCQSCLSTFIQRLRAHAAPCGCTFALQPRMGHTLPPWLMLPDDFSSCPTKQQVA